MKRKTTDEAAYAALMNAMDSLDAMLVQLRDEATKLIERDMSEAEKDRFWARLNDEDKISYPLLPESIAEGRQWAKEDDQ